MGVNDLPSVVALLRLAGDRTGDLLIVSPEATTWQTTDNMTADSRTRSLRRHVCTTTTTTTTTMMMMMSVCVKEVVVASLCPPWPW